MTTRAERATLSVMSNKVIPPERRVYCNRTLNLRSIRACGFDMDYTLVHYRTQLWEERAFEHAKALLKHRGMPVDGLKFRWDFAEQGLIIDQELGNVVKANRFGHVRQACHGTRTLTWEERRSTYSTAPIDLSENRWQFMNTLFSLSEAAVYMQMVDLLDEGALPGVLGYEDLYRVVKAALDAAHMEGELKAEILANPGKFVVLDDELVPMLLDMKHSGKRLLVITNSEWEYTDAMLKYALGRFLPKSQTWRDLFDFVIVQARKPAFFANTNVAMELDEPSGLYRPHVGPLHAGKVYAGADARVVEQSLGLAGDEILYFGDHMYADVHVSKEILRWRTALIYRELERELGALRKFAPEQQRLSGLMAKKDLLEHEFSLVRLEQQRAEKGYGVKAERRGDFRAIMKSLREEILALDEKIAPLAAAAGQLVSPAWGPSMRCGNDKSHLARQIERHADIYTSRVSNLLHYTPFAYLRVGRSSLPHDN